MVILGHETPPCTQQRWYLMQPGSSVGALVAVHNGWPQHTAYHYAGVEGAERLVRIEKAGVGVWHIEGKKGAERVTRTELPNGEVRLICDGHKLPALTRLRRWLCGASRRDCHSCIVFDQERISSVRLCLSPARTGSD